MSRVQARPFLISRKWLPWTLSIVKEEEEEGSVRARELRESRGGRRLPVPSSPYGLCGRKKQH